MLALLLFAPVIAGCSSTSDIFSSDLLSKDAEWFSRSGSLFIRNVSIETPPLTPNKPVTSEDLVSADGLCPGMAPPSGPADANALTDGAAAPPTPPTPGTGELCQPPRQRDRWRLVIPNAMSCGALARLTASISPTMHAAIGWGLSTIRRGNAPESILSHPGA